MLSLRASAAAASEAKLGQARQLPQRGAVVRIEPRSTSLSGNEVLRPFAVQLRLIERGLP